MKTPRALFLFFVTFGICTLGSCDFSPIIPEDPPLIPPAASDRYTLEAENGTTNGIVLGPLTTYRTVEAESSGRKCVKLTGVGEYISWTAQYAGNAVIVRYSIPDSFDGSGMTASLELRIDGTLVHTFSLSSACAWVYGAYPWTNNPANGNAHKFYDEAQVKLETAFPAGAKIEVRKSNADTDYIIIDLADFENVGPAGTKPANALSITEVPFNAAGDGATDDTAALASCIDSAKSQGKEVWIPAGNFKIGSVNVSNITIRGAGMWYSRLTGVNSKFECTGSLCRFYDFAVFGSTSIRNDNSGAENAFNGNPGSNSVLQRIWVERKKCAFWVGNWNNAVPADNLKILDCRFRNLMADAVNLCNGTSNSLIDGCSTRNTGDDALASWSPSAGGPICKNNTFSNNEVCNPWFASGIAVYGGSGHLILNNRISDTVSTGSGIFIAAHFSSWAFAGNITIKGNRVERCGSNESDPGGPAGGIRVLALDKDVNAAAILIEDNDIIDPVQTGISIQGPCAVTNLAFSSIRISGAPVRAIDIRSNAKGSAAFTSVTASSSAAGILNSAGANFTVIKSSENTGW